MDCYEIIHTLSCHQKLHLSIMDHAFFFFFFFFLQFTSFGDTEERGNAFLITSTITVVLFSTIVRTLILHTLLLFLAQMFDRMPETVPEIGKINYDIVVIDCFNMIVKILIDIFSFALGVWVDH